MTVPSGMDDRQQRRVDRQAAMCRQNAQSTLRNPHFDDVMRPQSWRIHLMRRTIVPILAALVCAAALIPVVASAASDSEPPPAEPGYRRGGGYGQQYNGRPYDRPPGAYQRPNYDRPPPGYGGPRPGYGGPPPGYYGGPPPGYYGGPPPGYYGGRPGYGYARPQQYSNICITARGNCGTRRLPYGTPCSCFIPGFGQKRGAIGY